MPRTGCRTSQRPILKRSCAGGCLPRKFLGSFREAPTKAPKGQIAPQPGKMAKIEGHFPIGGFLPRIDCRTSQRPILKRSCAGCCLPGQFPRNLRMGYCALHQSIRGTKPPMGKCPRIRFGLSKYLAPLWCNLAHKRFAGNFPETSGKLPGRQPAAPQNLRMGCCALHQSIRGQKPPVGKCPQIWAVLPHCGATWPTSVLREIPRKLPRICPGGSRPHPKT